MQLTVDAGPVRKLLHAKRVRIDPAFRGELVWIFDNPKARMAYYGAKGLLIDELAETLWDAGFVAERPTCVEVVDLLETMCAPGAVRKATSRRDTVAISRDIVDDVTRQYETRRQNRWRSYRCACTNGRPFRFAGDQLPLDVTLACSTCGEPFTLATIKLDLSNVTFPQNLDEVPF